MKASLQFSNYYSMPIMFLSNKEEHWCKTKRRDPISCLCLRAIQRWGTYTHPPNLSPSTRHKTPNHRTNAASKLTHNICKLLPCTVCFLRIKESGNDWSTFRMFYSIRQFQHQIDMSHSASDMQHPPHLSMVHCLPAPPPPLHTHTHTRLCLPVSVIIRLSALSVSLPPNSLDHSTSDSISSWIWG